MRWFVVLRKNGATEVRRLWKKGDDLIALKSSATAEVFGPFDAPSYPEAKLKMRAICAAVGFIINPDGILQNR